MVIEAVTDLATPLPSAIADVQAGRPQTLLALSHVGVTGVEKIVRLGPPGAELSLSAVIECSTDLAAVQRGAHMSRFDEAVEVAIDEVVLAGHFRVEDLAAGIAERVRERQESRRAEARLTVRHPRIRQAPASGAQSQELYTLLGAAVAREGGTRRAVGVRAQGITACPCGQAMATADARERLAVEGFDGDEIERVLTCVPVATHNQRGIGTLWIGVAEGDAGAAVEPDALLAIVESSMSSEVYELLKRADEAHIIEKAHRRPRFVEDCVRAMVRMAVERFGHLGATTFLSARQENLETIHQHNVVAQRDGLLGELARELRGDSAAKATRDLGTWLSAD
ncbi:MAG: GTP cyclohydrolase I FolE2 [Thermoleophilaceae bacterium]|nr:GTP cyclohydrolase I FolE2 [Thermoleophilaceae bacterium]